jgi:hypothetical protein
MLIWALRNKGEGTYLARIIGVLTAIACLFSLTSIGYYGFQYWLKGEYESAYNQKVAEAVQHMGGMELKKVNVEDQSN